MEKIVTDSIKYFSENIVIVKSAIGLLLSIFSIITVFRSIKLYKYKKLRLVVDDYFKNKSLALIGFKSLFGRSRTMEDLSLFMYDPLIGQNFEIFIKVKWFLRRDKNGKYIPGFRYKPLEILIYLLLSILSIISFLMGVAYIYRLSNSIDQFAPLKVALIFLLSLVPFLVTIYFVNILVEMIHAKKIFGDK